MSANAVSTLHLNQKILPGLVTSARFGQDDAASLVVVTASNKIRIYDLKTSENIDLTAQQLSFTQEITAVAAARFGHDDADVLLVSTQSQVFVYDVPKNRDVFARDVPDGGNVVAFGRLGSAAGAAEVVLVGGNCSVQGFDRKGDECFWMVTGDNVRSLALADVDNDGEEELLVGSDDYDIRIFKNDDLVHEITETQIVSHLLNVGNGLFAYALANGTVGMYDRFNRLWRVKSKNQASCLHVYDINGDGTAELMTGWQGGKVDGRNILTGEVLFKDNFHHTVAGICEGEARHAGKSDLLVVSITGEVRCYNPHSPKPFKINGPEHHEQDAIRELLSRKHNLLLQLKNYQRNVKQVASPPHDNNLSGAIPAKTKLQTTVGVTLGSPNQPPRVQLRLSTNNDTIIRAVIVFAEGIFKGETHVDHPRPYEVDHKITVSLYPPRDVPIDIHVKAFIGYPQSTHFHVFELTRQLPRFAMYTTVSSPPAKTVSSVAFAVKDRVQRVMLWVNRNFLLPHPVDINASSELRLYLVSLRDATEVAIMADQSGRMKIETDSMGLAGDLIQSLAAYLNLTELQSSADFPREEQKCVELLEKLRGLESVKGKLNVDLREKSGLIRHLLIRSEDARLLKDWHLMERLYEELEELNGVLRGGCEIREANREDMVTTVRELNGIVQKASRLRFGKYTTDPIVLSRNAMATNDSKSLIKAIRTGEA